MDIKKIVKDHEDLFIKTRRDLHRIPEPAFREEKTSAYIIDYLEKEGFVPKTGIAKYGVTALLEGKAPGSTLMIRSDIDALSMTEETGLEFASTHPGVMHACGHDGHMAMVLGAVTVLNKLKDQLKGNVKFIFQPAEEGPGGAKPMIEEGVMEDPHVDYAVGCHVWPLLSEGKIGVKSGPLMASMDRFDVKIKGRGGHGAMPHLCIDSLEIATQVVSALQRLISRESNPLVPNLLTVGQFNAGTAFNVIPDEAVFCGTTRTFDKDVWNAWPETFERVLKGICKARGAEYELMYQTGYPPLLNDAEMANKIKNIASQVVGRENIVEPEPTMGGEDMAFFLEKAKGCFFFLGSGNDSGIPVHNSKFTFNEKILADGVEVFIRAALSLL